MKDYRIVCYDFETEGFADTDENGNLINQPIEFGAITIEPDGSRRSYNFLIKTPLLKSGQRKPLNPKIIEITGIKNEDLEKDGIELEEAMHKIAEIIDVENRMGIRTVLVGHNIIRFDNIFLDFYLKKYGYDFSRFPKNDIFDTAGQFKYQIMKDKGMINESLEKKENMIYYDYHAGLLNKFTKGVYYSLTPNGKGGTCACEYYGIEMKKDAHRALNDVEYNIEVFLKQMEDIKKEKKEAKNKPKKVEGTQKKLNF